MNYSSEETLNENYRRILEQGTDVRFISPEQKANEYPNYCSYPKNTIIPGTNSVGASGLDALPEGFCCYRAPKQNSLDGEEMEIFLPIDAKINFWDIQSLDSAIVQHMKEKKLDQTNRVNLEQNFSKIFPVGTVRDFEISGVTYYTWIQRSKNNPLWYFNWYRNNDKKPYPKVSWTDPRSSWDKIVDDYIDVTQWSVAIASFIAGFFTEGATWLIYTEIATEGALGLIAAQRDLEKGDNLSAGFNLIFASLPWLKKAGYFTGVSSADLSRLIRSMKKAGLNAKSNPRQILSWFGTLNELDKVIWSKMVKASEEFSEAELSKLLKGSYHELLNEIKLNPSIIKNVKWYQKVPAKEFTLQAAFGFINLLVEIFYGDKLNESEKRKLTKIYNNAKQISDELANEVTENYIHNANKIKQIAENSGKLQNELLTPKGPPSKLWFNTEFKEVIESSDGTYVEIESDPNKAIPDDSVSQEEIQKYLDMGYKKLTDMSQEEKDNAIRPKKLNGIWYWLIEKGTNIKAQTVDSTKG